MGERSTTAALLEPPRRRRPGAGRETALSQEATRLRRDLSLFDELMRLAEDEDNEKLRDLAWSDAGSADPIRVLFARQLLGVSDRTIADWCRRGVLEEQPDSSPRRVTLVSVLRAKAAVDELRRAGRDRDLIGAVLNKLELDELRGSKRFRESLAQARRGKRGEWPPGW